MPYQDGLPYQSGSHSSWTGAISAKALRGRHTERYLDALKQVGPLTDHEAAAYLVLPLSSICSIRNGVKDRLVPCGFETNVCGSRCTKRQRWSLSAG